MLKRREVLINHDTAEFFIDFYREYYDSAVTLPVFLNLHKSWIIFQADDEFMVLAKLKFELDTISPWGTSIEITD